MKKALILHGWEGHNQENWFPWLKKTLISQGFQVFIPNLPNPNAPILQPQLDAIKDIVQNFEKGDFIIGHSLGCTLALQSIKHFHLQDLNFILVAPATHFILEHPAIQEVRDEFQTFFENKINKNSQNRFTVFLSDDDPYIDLENTKEYFAEFKNTNITTHKNKGHFNESAGIKELPEILEFIHTQTIHLSSETVTITENTTLIDTAELSEARITIENGVELKYVYFGENKPKRKRILYINSGAICTGSAIVCGQESGLDIESEILGNDAYSQLNLLSIATEGSNLSIAGNAKVEKPYRKTKTRVDQKNILIGKNASVQGIPRLEIATDDIEGGHSCRIYRLGGDVLFYLTSRGLSHDHAEQILLNSEIISHLDGLDEDEQKIYCKKIHDVLLNEK